MSDIRLRFSKTGLAKYISHLDLMRIFTRAMSRCDIPVKFTEGFNKRAYLVFGSPLSLGFESLCEFVEFDITEEMAPQEIQDRMNRSLPLGIHIEDAYQPTAKMKEIEWGKFTFRWECGADDALLEEIQKLFSREELVLLKKTKRGESNVDILPLIESLSFRREGQDIVGEAVLPQNGNMTLGPQYLLRAVQENIPAFHSEYESYLREYFLTKNHEIFR